MKEILGVNLYDVNEVAELLGVGSASVYLYIKRGLKTCKIKGKHYISEENLRAYLLGELKK